MKLFNILLIFITFTTAQASDTALLQEELKIESFSSAVVPLRNVTFIGRMEIRVKRDFNLFNSKDGIVRVLADGVEVDCIQFYSTTSRKWRSFIVNVGRTVRTLEFYNGLDRKVKIKQIIKLPSIHYGRVYRGNPSEVLDLSSQLIDVTGHLEHLVSSNDIYAINEIKLSASDLMNKVQVLGPFKVTNEINSLITLLHKHAVFIENLKLNQITMELANEISFVETALKRLID
jgi:hypothetical protein